jgi:L-lactate dehydrogenase
VDVLLHDQRAILTVCCNANDVSGCEGVTLALPRLVGGDGVLATIPLTLDPVEREALTRSASIIRSAVESLGVA